MDFRSRTSAHQLASSSSSSRSSISSRRLLRAVLGVLLLLSLSKAAPVSHTVLGQLDPYGEAVDAEEALSLLTFLRSLLNSARLQNESSSSSSSSSSDEDGGEEDINEVKRGFGIAGLDNVDMITSTLDRSRAMSRARHGRRYLTSGLTFKQLRALMERAG